MVEQICKKCSKNFYRFVLFLKVLYVICCLSVAESSNPHVDDYGFKHSYSEIPLAIHYISTQLNEHYNTLTDEYFTLKRQWQAILDELETPSTPENSSTVNEVDSVKKSERNV